MPKRREVCVAMEDEGRRTDASAFGVLLRQHRLAAGLSQEALAERARMSPDAVSALERGHRRSPQRATLALLAGALALEGEARRQFETASRSPRQPRRGVLAVGPWPGAAAPGAPPNNLPHQVTPLIGREVDLAKIVPLAREHSLITLIGAGGVGKTRLALEVGMSALEECEAGVWFVDLAPLNDPASVVRAIASTFGLSDQRERSLLDTVLHYLQSRRLMLVVDNCEHLIEEAARIVEALVRGGPNIRVLATSREPLRVAAEHVYRVPSLAVPSKRPITANEAGRYGAIALFAERATASDADFALTDDDAAVVAEICRRLDGIPLAIELAAARVTLLPPRQLLQRLDERLSILIGGSRTSVSRHQTMRALIDWSYELLAPEEQQIFRRLGIFAGGWTLGTAEAVCTGDTISAGDVENAIASLEAKSLIVADAFDDWRYRFLESMRAFAIEKLAASGELDDLSRRHVQWVVELSERIDRSCETNGTLTWQPDELEHELENALAAIDWAMANGEILVALQATRGFARVFGFADRARELRERLSTMLDRVDAKSMPEITARAWLALSYVTPGARGVEAAQRALKLGERTNGPAFTARCLNSIAWNLHRAGRPQEGEAYAERAVELLRRNGLTRSYEYADALNTAATIALVCGQLGQALQKYLDVHSLATAIGAQDLAFVAHSNTAVVEFSKGNAARAIEIVRTAEAERNGRRLKTYDKTMLANSIAYCVAVGDLRDARTRARELLSLSRGATVHSGYAINGLATIAALNGEPRRGARLRGYVCAFFRREGLDPERTEQFTSKRLKSALRERLSDAEIQSLAAEGAELTEEQAVADALLVV